jgi:hypothetical protein
LTCLIRVIAWSANRAARCCIPTRRSSSLVPK